MAKQVLACFLTFVLGCPLQAIASGLGRAPKRVPLPLIPNGGGVSASLGHSDGPILGDNGVLLLAPPIHSANADHLALSVGAIMNEGSIPSANNIYLVIPIAPAGSPERTEYGVQAQVGEPTRGAVSFGSYRFSDGADGSLTSQLESAREIRKQLEGGGDARQIQSAMIGQAAFDGAGVPRINSIMDFATLAGTRFTIHSHVAELRETGKTRAYDDQGHSIMAELRGNSVDYWYIPHGGPRILVGTEKGTLGVQLDLGDLESLPPLPVAPSYTWTEGMHYTFKDVFNLVPGSTELRWIFLWSPASGAFAHLPYGIKRPDHKAIDANPPPGPMQHELGKTQWGGRVEVNMHSNRVRVWFDSLRNPGPLPPKLRDRFRTAFALTYHIPTTGIDIADWSPLGTAIRHHAQDTLDEVNQDFRRTYDTHGRLSDWILQSLEGKTVRILQKTPQASANEVAQTHRRTLAEYYLRTVIEKIILSLAPVRSLAEWEADAFTGNGLSLLGLALSGFNATTSFQDSDLGSRGLWARQWLEKVLSVALKTNKANIYNLIVFYRIAAAYLTNTKLPSMTKKSFVNSSGYLDISSSIELLEWTHPHTSSLSAAEFGQRMATLLKAFAEIPGLVHREHLQAQVVRRKPQNLAKKLAAAKNAGRVRGHRKQLRKLPLPDGTRLGPWMIQAVQSQGLRKASIQSGMGPGELLLHLVDLNFLQVPEEWLDPGFLGLRLWGLRLFELLRLRGLGLKIFGKLRDEGLLRAIGRGEAPEQIGPSHGVSPQSVSDFIVHIPW